MKWLMLGTFPSHFHLSWIDKLRKAKKNYVSSLNYLNDPYIAKFNWNITESRCILYIYDDYQEYYEESYCNSTFDILATIFIGIKNDLCSINV